MLVVVAKDRWIAALQGLLGEAEAFLIVAKVISTKTRC
jgi:hypothetical protein